VAFVCRIAAVALTVLLANSASIAQAGVNVSGTISTNTTWNAANSPYTVTADVTVTDGAQLTIQPGVTIYFAAGTNLTVASGTLIAKALTGQPILLTSARDIAGATPAPGDWGQLRFTMGTNATTDLDGVEIRFGTQISVLASSPQLNRLVIRSMSGPAIAVDLAASPRGVDLVATGNQLNGIRVPAGEITGSVAWSMTGIPYVVESGIVAVGVAPSITGISPSVFAVGKTVDATIFGSGLTTVEALTIDRSDVNVTQRSGASSVSIPITLAVPSDATPGSATITVVVGTGTVSVPISITTNQPPVVALTSPIEAAEYTSPATVQLTASASTPNSGGIITRVDFLLGATLIGTSTSPSNGTYNFTWTSVPAGIYSITARATDSFGGVTTSAPANITVFQAPSIEVRSPLGGALASTELPLAMSVRATSGVAGVRIAKVEFISYQGEVLATLTTGVNDVYSAVWNNIPGGYNWLVARATDSRGGVATSPQIHFIGIRPPDVTITSPANNASYPDVPSSVVLKASASSGWSERGVTITQVDFYEGANLLGTGTTATNNVFSVTWNANKIGVFAVTAKATDSVGNTRRSAPIAISVGATKPTLPYAMLGIVKGDVTGSATPVTSTAVVGVVKGDVTGSATPVTSTAVVGVVKGDVTSSATGLVGPLVSPVVGMTK
jgi:hypothetical protein